MFIITIIIIFWALITGNWHWHIHTHTHTHTHTHNTFNGPFTGTTRMSRYQKGKTNLDFTEARDSEWQWHQLGHMQVCTSLQTDNHASTVPHHSVFTGRMPFLPLNQQRQSTEGSSWQWRKQETDTDVTSTNKPVIMRFKLYKCCSKASNVLT